MLRGTSWCSVMLCGAPRSSVLFRGARYDPRCSGGNLLLGQCFVGDSFLCCSVAPLVNVLLDAVLITACNKHTQSRYIFMTHKFSFRNNSSVLLFLDKPYFVKVDLAQPIGANPRFPISCFFQNYSNLNSRVVN